MGVFCFFKQKTAYEMRISDWSADVCSSDLAASTMTAPQRVATVSQGSTCSPSTFCQPLGSSPPRLARAPMYWSKSLNDSDIVRAPDFPDRVPPGAPAALATTYPVPPFALGIPLNLFPLHLHTSGPPQPG